MISKIVSLSIVAAAVASADPADYVNFVRQIQNDTGVEWDVSVEPSGSMLSAEGVGPAGSLFQLWSIHSATAGEYHLDEEFVSAYTPEAGITIETGDPYTVRPRTRVDQPFTVTIEVSGLVTGILAGDPTSAAEVLLTHAGGVFPSGQHSFDEVNVDGSDPEGTASEDPHLELGSARISSNGSTILSYPLSNLTGPDPTKVEGEEVWTVSSLAAAAGDGTFIEGEVLERATLQVWPIAEAAVSGIDLAASYQDPPPISVALRDLYPDSTTWLRVYQGSPSAPAGDPVDIQTSYAIIQAEVPQDRPLYLEELGAYFPASGNYTLEVVHRTPFGTEILSQLYPISIDRSIEVRGSLFSTE